MPPPTRAADIELGWHEGLGGCLKNVTSSKALISASLAGALMVVQVASLQLMPWEAAVRVVLPATIALAPAALWVYRKRLGTWMIFVGLAANLAAILANGGLMPIERSTVVEAIGEDRAAQLADGDWISGSKDVLVGPGDGRLLALGDSIMVPLGGGGFIASPGDVVVWSGLVVLAAETSVAFQRGARRRKAGIDLPPLVRSAPEAEGGATT